MTTINGLTWEPHPAGFGGERARITFANGYTASVVRGGIGYTKGGTYEIAVMRDGRLDLSTPITDDVLGFLSEEAANNALAAIAALPTPADAA